MDFRPNKEDDQNLLLLREELWKLEDKINILAESEADHEAELIRQKRRLDLMNNRIDTIDHRQTIKCKHSNEDGK
jgi:hypothetical protein